MGLDVSRHVFLIDDFIYIMVTLCSSIASKTSGD